MASLYCQSDYSGLLRNNVSSLQRCIVSGTSRFYNDEVFACSRDRRSLGSQVGSSFGQGPELLRRDLQNLSHLLIPVLPIVITGQLAVLVRDLLLAQKRGELLVHIDQEIFGATVQIHIRQP